MCRKSMKTVLAGILAASIIVTGCGAGSSGTGSSGTGSSGASDREADSYARAESAESSAADDAVSGEEADKPASGGEAETDNSGAADPDSGDDSALRQAEKSEKIVYTGDMEIQTLAYDSAAESIRSEIREAGGFVESESEYNDNYNWYDQDVLYDGADSSADNSGSRTLYITARIPSEQFENFMKSVEGEGEVISRSVNAENISRTYADTQASKEALEKEEQRLLEMMDKAESVEDMISVESRLSEVERELNRYKTDLASMDRDIEYSTVNITLDEVKRYNTAQGQVSFVQRIQYAAADAVDGFISFCKNAAVFAVRYFPYLLIVLIVILLLTRRVRKRRARRRAMAESHESPDSSPSENVPRTGKKV